MTKPPSLLLALVVAGVCLTLLLVQTATLALRRHRRRNRIVTRARTAAEGERRAAAWLTQRGFTVQGAQVATEYPLRVDGNEAMIAIRADYLVSRGALRYVVEVKTGPQAPRVQTPATRRQLLEYRMAFDVDGVLLLDMTAGTLCEVTFPHFPPSTAAAKPGGTAFLSWLALASVATLAYLLTKQFAH